jgi:bleomycin hydrolase
MDAALTAADLDSLGKEFAANPANRVMQNAVTQTSVLDLALDREIVTSIDRSVSHLLDDWKPTDQKRSGRCWLFAGLNLLRVGAAKEMGLKDFEFSQNHLMYWDKLERANYFLEAVIERAGCDSDDRTVVHLLDTVADDGGQWNMFVSLVRKHGLVPKSAMPETNSSSETRTMNAVLRTVLRRGALELRRRYAGGETDADALRVAKREILTVVHRVLGIHLGTPPERFFWQWTDKDRNFHRDGELTPLEFAEKYVTIPLEDYVCLVHDPRPSSPMGSTFTVDCLGNVVGGDPVVYLNVEMDLIKQLAMQAVMGGEPVWFGCDVDKMMRGDIGIWDANLYDLSGVYATDLSLTKAERLTVRETQMTHAMLFTGVDVVDGKPRRWRVENSWGEERADKGFYTMNDSWFDEHVFEIAARREALPKELASALDAEPIVLPAWDPMGSLAR